MLSVSLLPILLAALIAVASVWDRYERELHTARHQSGDLALALAELVERVLDSAELVLRATAQDVFYPVNGARPGRERLDGLLRARVSGLRYVQGHSARDAGGRPLASSRALEITTDFVLLEVFRHIARTDASDTFITLAYQFDGFPRPGIPVVRRVTAPDGTLLGIVSISIEPDYFNVIYAALRRDQPYRIRLLRTDGVVLAGDGAVVYRPEEKAPPPLAVVRSGISGPAVKAAPERNEAGWVVMVAPLSRFPLVAEVALPRDAVLAGWRRQAWVIGAVTTVICLFLVLVAVGLCRELVKREQAEQRLSSQSRLLQTVFDTVPHHIWVKDRAGMLQVANLSLERYVGQSTEQLRGQRVVGEWFRPPEENARILEEDRRALELGKGLEATQWATGPDGQRRRFYVVKQPWRDATGCVAGLVGVSVDVTELTRSEEALRESQTLLKAVFDAIPLALLVKDLEGRLLVVNAPTAERWGLTPEQMTGMNVKEMSIPPDERRLVEETDARVARENRILDYELKRTMPDGRVRLLRAIKAPLHGPDGRVTGILGISEDITDRRRMEEDKAALERQLQQVQKMDTVGRLAGGIAHDFNNLLTPVIGFVDLALTRIRPDDPLRQELGMIREAAARAAELTQGLLSFSRSQVMTLRPVNLNAEVRALHRMISRVIGEDIEIVLNLDPLLGTVEADAAQMQQVLMNLAVNARDAMPNGGKLVIETREVDLDSGYAERVLQTEPGPYVMVSVSDTGVGMSAETQARIFEPFFTTKEPGKGTGLGLSIVYGIVRQHRGAIHVYSTPGHGTSFKLLLPRLAAHASPAESPHRPLSALRGSERVLVVEDEARVREAVCALLASLGYDVAQAASPGDALGLLENAKRGPPHLLVTDIMLPGQSGGDLYAALRGRVPGLRVLYMSGYPRDMLAGSAAAVPSRFIGKPFGLAELAEKVRAVLEAPAP
jgi:PAS domain S-box-containing protein